MQNIKGYTFAVRLSRDEEKRLKGLAEALDVSAGAVVRRLIKNAKVSTVQRVDADLGAGGSG